MATTTPISISIPEDLVKRFDVAVENANKEKTVLQRKFSRSSVIRKAIIAFIKKYDKTTK